MFTYENIYRYVFIRFKLILECISQYHVLKEYKEAYFSDRSLHHAEIVKNSMSNFERILFCQFYLL